MSERRLCFKRAGRSFVLEAREISEIAADRELTPVPLAPSAVAGLTLERGRLLTVLDLDRLLRIRAESEGGPYLVMLAPPWANIALRLRSDLRLESEDVREGPAETIDIGRMIQTIEAVIATRSSASERGD